MALQAHTETRTINAPAEQVYALVADAMALPRWATGFAKAVRAEGDAWRVETPHGEVKLAVVADAKSGVVDYIVSPAPGVSMTSFVRVLPSGEHGSEVLFTLMQYPGLPDEAFAQQCKTVSAELENIGRAVQET